MKHLLKEIFFRQEYIQGGINDPFSLPSDRL
jgi:hypothetical protein